MTSVPNAALGSFLRSCRDRLTPATAGFTPFPGVRRVPGLRKDELAVLAGISPDHYSRLEQGRQTTLSDELCDALARALRLDEVEQRHLRALAKPQSRRPERQYTQHAEPSLLRVMTAVDHLPALLLGRRGEVLARNALLEAVLDTPIAPGMSFTRWLLLDPVARERIVNWEDFAQAAVGGLRYKMGQHPDDRRLAALVADLRTKSSAIGRWWNHQMVTDRASTPKTLNHPRAGILDFSIEAVALPHAPDQRLVIYTTAPDSPTSRLLPLLASWTPASA